MDAMFNSELFLLEVKEDVRSELNRTINRLEDGLLKSTARGGSIDTGELRQCCDRLRRILAKSFSQNIKKFEVYSEENIFLRANSGSAPAISSSTRDLLNQLRAEYAQELEAFESMSREKQQLAALLREMQASLFELRVSGQALDSLSLHPLDEAMARISQQVRQLSAMCINADAITASLREEGAGPTIDFSSEDLIMTGNVEDINLLAEQFEN